MSDNTNRTIQSFVRRSGRLSAGQKYGLNDLWSQYGIEPEAGQAIDLNAVFHKQQDIILEVGFGNGDSLLQMAINEPHHNFFRN